MENEVKTFLIAALGRQKQTNSKFETSQGYRASSKTRQGYTKEQSQIMLYNSLKDCFISLCLQRTGVRFYFGGKPGLYGY